MGTFSLKRAELFVSVFQIYTESWIVIEETCRIKIAKKDRRGAKVA